MTPPVFTDGPIPHGVQSPCVQCIEFRAILESHPGYAADTTCGEIWQWLARKEAALAKGAVA